MRSLPRSSLAAIATLAAAGAVPGQIKVALCGAANTTSTSCQWTDVQNNLLSTGRFSAVDIINVTTTGGGTPTLEQLCQYDALLCWTNLTPANNNTWGDVLADYVDHGGGVVVAVFANSSTTTGRNIGGRWQSGYEVILDQTGSTTGTATLGLVPQPAHPVMAGVTTFNGGTSSFRPTGTALEVGSSVVAEWSDGRVLVAQGALSNRVDLGFYPPSAACTATWWTGDGTLMMANALELVADTAKYCVYGAGCAGSQGVPTLAPAPGSRPVLGATLQVTVSNVPLSIGLMVLGVSDTFASGLPLPLDLTLIGMPNCNLLTDVFQSVFLVGSANTLTYGLAIPSTGTLLGARFYNQAGVIDPGVNAAGFTISNGGRARVGLP